MRARLWKSLLIILLSVWKHCQTVKEAGKILSENPIKSSRSPENVLDMHKVCRFHRHSNMALIPCKEKIWIEQREMLRDFLSFQTNPQGAEDQASDEIRGL